MGGTDPRDWAGRTSQAAGPCRSERARLKQDSDAPSIPTASGSTQTQTRERAKRFGSIFASLAYRDFRYLWMGQVTHSAALWVDMVARPLLVLALTGSAVHLGLVIAVRTVPAFGLGLVAGVVADSFNRRTVLITTKLIVLVLGTLFAVALVLDWIVLWHVYLFTFLRGATQAFDQPARRAMVPSIVPKHLVTNAMALSSGSVQVMRIFGAGGAGLLIAFGGIEAAFVAVAAIYLAAVFFTWRLNVPDHVRKGYRGVSSMLSDLTEGFRYAWNSPDIRGIVVVGGGYFSFGTAFIFVFAPLIAVNVLEIGDSGFGYLMAAMGAGGVVGSLALAAINPRKRRGLIAVGTLALVGLLLVAVGATSYYGSAFMVFATVVALGLGQSWVIPIINATILDAAPEDMRGRMLGLLSLDRATATLGGAAAGFLAAGVGAPTGQVIFGVACVVTAAVMFVFYPAIRQVN